MGPSKCLGSRRDPTGNLQETPHPEWTCWGHRHDSPFQCSCCMPGTRLSSSRVLFHFVFTTNGILLPLPQEWGTKTEAESRPWGAGESALGWHTQAGLQRVPKEESFQPHPSPSAVTFLRGHRRPGKLRPSITVYSAQAERQVGWRQCASFGAT